MRRPDIDVTCITRGGPGPGGRDGASVRRRCVWAAAGVVLAIAVAVGTYRAASRTNDYTIFYQAFRHLAMTKALPEGQLERYPPTFVSLLAPLGYLPLWASALMWNAINAACLLALPFLLARGIGIAVSRQWLGLLTVLPFAWDNLTLGQSGPLLLAMAAGALVLGRTGWPALAGLLLGMASAIKVIPIVLLPALAALGRMRRVLLGFSVALAIALTAVVVWLGPRSAMDSWRQWAHRVGGEYDADEMLQKGRSLRYNNQSLPVVVGRTFGDRPAEMREGSIQLLSLPLYLVQAGSRLIQLALVVLWVLGALRIRKAPRNYQGRASLFAAGCLLMLLLSPIVWTHYFLWWLPALVCLAERRRLLAVVAVVSTVALCCPLTRAFGAHLVLTLVLYVLLIHGILRKMEARPARAADDRS